MNKIKISLIIVLVVILVYLYISVNKKSTNTTIPSVPASDIDFSKMSDGEQLEYIIRLYFDPTVKNIVDEKTIAEDKYIESLPKNSNCSDSFSDCAIWAKSGECTVNPEFMMYNCKKSCQSCAMTPEQLYNYTKIYNSRDAEVCVYRGRTYPDINMEYIRKYNI